MIWPMAKISQPRPTDAELEILRVLWQRGASTVRDVFDALSKTKPIGYTTVLKFMQIMAEKGLVRRDEEQRAHVYSAMVPQVETQRQMVRDLLRRAFDDSASQLVMQALASKKTSPEELAEIRRLLAAYDRGDR
jgi:BlaI family transcriptional regulator, penicillinase repressor